MFTAATLLIGGDNIRAEGGHWMASVSHVSGLFKAPLWGMAPGGKLVFLRSGEFYRVETARCQTARRMLALHRSAMDCWLMDMGIPDFVVN